MNEQSPIIVFGGTFDPIHNGHLRLAENLHNLAPEATIRMMPSARPPLREQPQTRAEDRLAMLKLAVAGSPHLVADDRELFREGKSYTLFSIQELAREYPDRPIVLVLGTDAYEHFSKWHQWQKIIELAALLVVSRPMDKIAENPVELAAPSLTMQQCDSIEQLVNAKNQAVFYYSAPMLDISATQIRDLVANMRSARFLLPQSVIQYIEQHNLYVKPSTPSLR